jgi:hypothetical protein
MYLRFLRLTETVRGLPALPPLDPLEERILNTVACLGAGGARLSVRDIMGRSEFGAPATIHARLKAMREKGWICLANTEDMRRKQIELSQAALLYFDKLSTCVMEVAGSAEAVSEPATYGRDLRAAWASGKGC